MVAPAYKCDSTLGGSYDVTRYQAVTEALDAQYYKKPKVISMQQGCPIATFFTRVFGSIWTSSVSDYDCQWKLDWMEIDIYLVPILCQYPPIPYLIYPSLPYPSLLVPWYRVTGDSARICFLGWSRISLGRACQPTLPESLVNFFCTKTHRCIEPAPEAEEQVILCVASVGSYLVLSALTFSAILIHKSSFIAVSFAPMSSMDRTPKITDAKK